MPIIPSLSADLVLPGSDAKLAKECFVKVALVKKAHFRSHIGDSVAAGQLLGSTGQTDIQQIDMWRNTDNFFKNPAAIVGAELGNISQILDGDIITIIFPEIIADSPNP